MVATLRIQAGYWTAKTEEVRHDLDRLVRYNASSRGYNKQKKEQTDQILEDIKERRAHKATVAEVVAGLEQTSLGINSDTVMEEVGHLRTSIHQLTHLVNLLDDEFRQHDQKVADQSKKWKRMVNCCLTFSQDDFNTYINPYTGGKPQPFPRHVGGDSRKTRQEN